MSSYNKVLASYLGLIILLSGIGFGIALLYFVYEIVKGVRSFDIILLLFTLLISIVSTIAGYKILSANKQ